MGAERGCGRRGRATAAVFVLAKGSSPNGSHVPTLPLDHSVTVDDSGDGSIAFGIVACDTTVKDMRRLLASADE